MSRIWNEQFEAAGYDETWSGGETVGAGCTLDEDADPSDVSNPRAWGNKCLKVISATPGFGAYVLHTFGSPPDPSFLRLEVVVTAESLANTQGKLLANSTDGSNPIYNLLVYQIADVLVFLLQIYHDGSANNYLSSVISLNTKYRVELQWDVAGDLWEWKVNGVSQDNGALTATHPGALTVLAVGVFSGNAVALTVYIDLVTIDDAAWVGEEIIIPVMMHHHTKNIRSI